MPLIGALIDFTPLSTARSSDVDANFAAIRTAFNDSAVLTDVGRIISVTHVWNALQTFNQGATFSHATGLYTDTITERTPALGVTVDGVLLKDGGVTLTGGSTGTSLSLSGTLAVTGVTTHTGDVVAAVVRRATPDGADNSSLVLAGAGAAGYLRGAVINLYGNEHASLGSIELVPGNVAGARIVFTHGNATEAGRMADGNLVWGTGALAVGAVSGFVYIPTSPGAPTGVPTAYAGRAPIHIDSTNGRFYAYYGGAWHYAALT